MSPSILNFTSVIVIILIIIVLFSYGSRYFPEIFNPSEVDVGYDTYDALKSLSENILPYDNPDIGKIGNRSDLWGYHYGPATLLFYYSAGLFPDSSGIKFMNLFYLILLSLFLAFSVYRKDSGFSLNLFLISFVLLLLLLPERLWYESFISGATDFFPSFLILLSVFFISRQKYLYGGLLLGLSISVKFAPALFLAVLLLKKKIPLSLINGTFIGLIPSIIALLISPNAFNSMILFHIIKPYNSSSLYSLAPAAYHFIPPLLAISAIIFFVSKDFKNKIKPEPLIFSFFYLLTIIELTYKELHANHYLWFIPLSAYILGLYAFRQASIK